MPSPEIVKGFEHEKGQFVVLEDADFDKVKIESTHSIEITDFVELAQINPKFFYKPYFLEAQKGGEKGYTLLHRALAETGKIGIAKVAIKNREYLAAVKPDGLFLILELMHFAQEVLEPEGLKSAGAGGGAEGARDGQGADRRDDERLGAGEVRGPVPDRAEGDDRGEDPESPAPHQLGRRRSRWSATSWRSSSRACKRRPSRRSSPRVPVRGLQRRGW